MKTIITERHDPVRHPAHYEVYPIQPIQITRHLGFCLGNAVKYVLRAPWKGSVEDCDKALEYLRLENQAPQPPLSHFAYIDTQQPKNKLIDFLCHTPGDTLWKDIAMHQAGFLNGLGNYLVALDDCISLENRPLLGLRGRHDEMMVNARELRRVLALRDTTGQIYEGMTGRPYAQEAE